MGSKEDEREGRTLKQDNLLCIAVLFFFCMKWPYNFFTDPAFLYLPLYLKEEDGKIHGDRVQWERGDREVREGGEERREGGRRRQFIVSPIDGASQNAGSSSHASRWGEARVRGREGWLRVVRGRPRKREEEPGLCFPVDDMTEGGKERRQEKTNREVFLLPCFLFLTIIHSASPFSRRESLFTTLYTFIKLDIPLSCRGYFVISLLINIIS